MLVGMTCGIDATKHHKGHNRTITTQNRMGRLSGFRKVIENMVELVGIELCRSVESM